MPILALVELARAVPPGWQSARPGRIAQLGQGLIEYGIILGLGTLLAVVILVVFGDQVADIVQWIGRTVDATTGGR